MSQEVSVNQTNSDIYTEQISAQPWSAEAYADKLMDDLFSDIDRLLDGSGKLPTEPVKQEYLSLQPIKVPPVTAPPVVIPPQPQVPAEETANTLPTVNPPAPPPAPAIQEPSILPRASSRSPGFYFEKILLGATCVAGLATAFLWWVNQNKPTWLIPQNTVILPTPEKAVVSEANMPFIAYMMRSLEVIDRKSQANKPQATTTPVPTAAVTPIYIPQIPSQAPTVLERVFIPYQTPQTPTYQTYQQQQTVPPPPQAFIPSVPRSTAVAPVTPSKLLVPATPSKLVAPTSRQISVPSTVKPQVPKAVIPQPTSAVPMLNSAINASSDSVPKYTLLGLLELGDRSAALFDVGGATQRIRAGESIGTSGWTLVAVANQEAVIRRNGEIRSIYVGQKF